LMLSTHLGFCSVLRHVSHLSFKILKTFLSCSLDHQFGDSEAMRYATLAQQSVPPGAPTPLPEDMLRLPPARELKLSLPRFVVHLQNLLPVTRTTSKTLCKASERRCQGNYKRNGKKHVLHGRCSSSKCLQNACGLTKNGTLARVREFGEGTGVCETYCNFT
jgi:hypothetical protein